MSTHSPHRGSENGGGREKNDYGRDKDKERDKDRKKSSHKSRERSRDRDRDRDRDRSGRDGDRSDRNSRDVERGNRDRNRDREDDSNNRGRNQRHRGDRNRDNGGGGRGGGRDERMNRGGRDHGNRDRNNRNHNHADDYENRHRKGDSPGRSSHKRDHGERSRSRSHGRGSGGGGGGGGGGNRRDRERSRERNSRELSSRELLQREMEREVMRMERVQEPMRMEPIKEEPRENRFDLAQTLQELMQHTTSKNFSSMFNCSNSNDSMGNGLHCETEEALERKRRRKSRWGGSENDKTFIPGMPTILPSTLDPVQQEAYLVQLQIEEISRKLRTGELGIPQNPEERSPSPEPIYSSDGKRLNTREFRCRKRLEEQRHHLIQKMQSVNPEFKPPADYKPPVTRVSDKVLIPQEEHPDINFVGLLIGPRGNTLKAMEKETGAKIIIRGKGSVKEGKVGRKDGQPLPGEDEPLHAFITAPNLDAVKKAVEKIKEVIRQGIEVPEGHNDLRRMQLRELAQLNGTLRETDSQRCTCGSTDHKSWMCPEKPIVTNTIVCAACGGIGHLTKDCRNKRPGTGADGEPQSEDTQAKIDEEYMSLMAELGEGPPAQSQKPDPLAQVHLNRGYSIFDKKPSQMQAIQSAPPMQQPPSLVNMQQAVPPPPMPNWGSSSSMGIPPLIPPPPSSHPPVAPPPLMSWMSATQPPPPGGEPPMPGGPLPPPPPGTSALQPPGTAPIPPLMAAPPPPGTSAPLPPWPPSAPVYGGWGSTGNGYMQPPPPPPLAPPPPGMPSLSAPPPPPPPNM